MVSVSVRIDGVSDVNEQTFVQIVSSPARIMGSSVWHDSKQERSAKDRQVAPCQQGVERLLLYQDYCVLIVAVVGEAFR